MTTAMTARTGRLLAKIGVVGTLALLLSTVVTPSARAYDRADAVVLANKMIDRCFKEGGEPDAVSGENDVTVYCRMPEGQVGDFCTFWPGTPTCLLLPNPHGPHTEIPTDRVQDDGGSSGPREGIGAPATGTGELLTKQDAPRDDRSRDHKTRKHRHQRGKQ